MPLVYQSFNWAHGVYMAATMGSETTAAARARSASAPRPDGDAAVLRLQHGRLLQALARRWARPCPSRRGIFRVNWFRRDANGKFLWPGFGENMRVLKWIVDRVNGKVPADRGPLGWVPRQGDILWKGLDYPAGRFAELMAVDGAGGAGEAEAHETFFRIFEDRLPPEFAHERAQFAARLGIGAQRASA